MKKKYVFFPLCAMLSCLLTSCEAHWFGKSYDVPWWGIAIPVLMIFLLTLIFGGRWLAKTAYACPFCGKHFYPRLRAIFAIHIGSKLLLKCPHCKERRFCSPDTDWEDRE